MNHVIFYYCVFIKRILGLSQNDRLLWELLLFFIFLYEIMQMA